MSWEDGHRIGEMAKALMKKNSGLSYGEALRTVINENRDKPFVRRYLGLEPIYISPNGQETNPKPKGPGIKKGRGEESKVQYVVGHPDYPDPHGRTRIGQDPRTHNHNGGTQMDSVEAGKRIDKLVQEYLHEHPKVAYSVALESILCVYPELKEAYAATTEGEKFYTTPDDPEAKRAIREEVHVKVMAHMNDTGEDDYETAMEEVFSADPSLKEQYAQS